MKQTTFDTNGVLSSQKQLLPRLYRSHRILIINFFASLIMPPLWFVWVFIFVAAIAESLEWFLLITSVSWVSITLFIISFWFRGRAFFGYMQSSKRFLDEAKQDINASKTAEDFTTYMNLLFPVLRPWEAPKPDTTTRQQQQIRNLIRNLKFLPIIEIVVLVTLIGSFASFFIRYPYILPPLLQTPIIPYLWFNMIFMIVRFGIFLKYRQHISRWLHLYEALTIWQANLEATIQQSDNITGREV